MIVATHSLLFPNSSLGWISVDCDEDPVMASSMLALAKLAKEEEEPSIKKSLHKRLRNCQAVGKTVGHFLN